MKALSKSDEKKKAELVDAIRMANTDLQAAIEEYDKAVTAEQAKVKEALKAVNAKIQEAKEWAEGIASEMQEYYDEKSERWQEGDNGQQYSEWKDSYENFSPDDLEIEFPEELEVVAADAADDLENLPDEP
jgi:hypothetical protein